MQHKHQTILALLSGVLLLGTPMAFAAESASFRLYDEHPNYADRNAAESSSFQMNEAGETWVALPLSSGNFQIVTAPPAQAVADDDDDDDGNVVQDGGGGTGGFSGGHRGHRTNEHGGLKPSAPDPVAPPRGQVIDLDIDAPAPFVDLHIDRSSIPYAIEIGEKQLCNYHLFSHVDPEPRCKAAARSALYIPVIQGAQRPIATLLLMILAFIAGYFAPKKRS